MPHLVEDTPTAGHPHLEAPASPFSRLLDGLIRVIAVTAHISWLVLIVVIITNVIRRYLLSDSSVALEEWQWHLYAYGFMVGIAYCLVEDQHVRVDVLAEKWPAHRRAWIELLAMVILVMPFAFVIAGESIPFVEFSHKLSEVSRSPGGLTHRWLIKALIPFAMVLIFLAALSRVAKVIALIRNR
ncbi:TRAP transporter small permease subunit [uncultured Paracoccus sp.]|uniref:TRAP transporter small permease subunit n=1 Tax=uncultured Paracoccus sp. TaxID=189685 RepID=UPI00262C3660|nr:TRAP transporter small permease subunit [uncultured Paracoccus sp.]HMR36676.1 TRAP transporter small permease subunit [Paracoccus sp. (in: a-proteobacteria)]